MATGHSQVRTFSKVDRSAAYAARWWPSPSSGAGLCKRVLVQVVDLCNVM